MELAEIEAAQTDKGFTHGFEVCGDVAGELLIKLGELG